MGRGWAGIYPIITYIIYDSRIYQVLIDADAISKMYPESLCYLGHYAQWFF